MQRGASIPAWRKPRNCADARYLAWVWAKRSRQSRYVTERYRTLMAERTLRDFEVRDGNHAWERAVREAQKPFPGTEAWLLSCSAAEGGHGRWVTYGGGSDYLWAKANYVVGGHMQFKYPTFVGMFRRSVEYAQAKGFIVPGELTHDMVRAWTSALGQAMAAGWARYTGNDASHWSASWGRGC